MKITFVWPSAEHGTGGVVVLYEFANALSRRDHDVHFVTGAEWTDDIRWVTESDAFDFEPAVQRIAAASLDDPHIPTADVVFWSGGPPRLGRPVIVIQGHRIFPEAYEAAAFAAPVPKVCIARWLVDVGSRLGVPDDELWYVPLGLDHERFRVRRPTGERPYDVAILHNRHPTKGWFVGLDALTEARRRMPSLRAVVFSSTAIDGALPEWIDLRVGLSQEALARDVYDAAKVFVQSSFYEGFGLTAVEAMACGAALVTTDNGGSRDYAFHDRTAWVAPPGDASALADGIEALVRDGERRAAIAGAGAAFVRQFRWDEAAAILEELLIHYTSRPPLLDGLSSTMRHPPNERSPRPTPSS